MRSLAKLLAKAAPTILSRKPIASVDAPGVGSRSVDEPAKRDLMDKAGAEVAAGRFGDALERIERAMAVAPYDGELAFARASTLFSWGRYWEACAAHRDALRLGFASSDL